MEQILWIIIAAAVIVFAGGSILFISMGSIDSVIEFSDDAEDAECQTQANLWEPGDSINQECVDQLPEESQEQALADAFESDLT